MANALYDSGREGFLDGSIDWDTDDIRAILLKTGYSFSAAHVYVSDLTTASYDNGRSSALSGKTKTAGVADASDITTGLNATAATLTIAVVLYKYNAADASARLICYIDTATGLSFTPAAGQQVNISWNDGTNKIFKL
jgi:hypothetical protein